MMKTFNQIRDRLNLAKDFGMFFTDEERSSIDHELDTFIELIANDHTVEDADAKLQELGQIQEVLATMCFKYRIDLSGKQRTLVRIYDRWDTLEIRLSAFKAIRSGTFP